MSEDRGQRSEIHRLRRLHGLGEERLKIKEERERSNITKSVEIFSEI